MTNYLKTFEPGDKIKATDTNDNNQYLLDEITTSAGAISADVTTKLATKADLTLSNVTSLSAAIQTLLGDQYAKKDLSNTSGAFSNISATDKATIVSLMMPNYSAGVSAPNNYTCPKDGWVVGKIKDDYGNDAYVTVGGQAVMGCDWTRTADYSGIWHWFAAPAPKGAKVVYKGTTSYISCKFYPCKGV